jgi:hypothetical protein
VFGAAQVNQRQADLVKSLLHDRIARKPHAPKHGSATTLQSVPNVLLPAECNRRTPAPRSDAAKPAPRFLHGHAGVFLRQPLPIAVSPKRQRPLHKRGQFCRLRGLGCGVNTQQRARDRFIEPERDQGRAHAAGQ